MRRRGPISQELVAFLQGPVAAMLGSADGTSFPDVSRITGIVALDDRRLRVLHSSDSVTARANLVVGARVAVLATDIRSYRSIQFKGQVVEAGSSQSPGDIALVDRYVETFAAAAPDVGLDPDRVDRIFAAETVPVVLEVDAVFDQTPGPGAGLRIETS